jgi:hypothetical protein
MNLAEKAWSYMLSHGATSDEAAAIIEKDYCFGAKRRDLPVFLKTQAKPAVTATPSSSLKQRQLRHLN